jgi:hypothetical protein
MEDKDNPKKIINQITDLKSELEELQSKCDHVPTIKFDNEKRSVVKRCELCDYLMGYATEKERKDHGFGNM